VTTTSGATINWSDNVIDGLEDYSVGGFDIVGNDADNYIRTWNGVSSVRSGAGDDHIQVNDPSLPNDGDSVDCGEGTDLVYADAGDTVSDNCERVNPDP
jgi:hypothetical protein